MRQVSIDAMNKYFGFEGKTAIVTGSGTGIGKGIADLFADLGANVVLCGRRLEKVEEVAEGIRSRGGKALAVKYGMAHKPSRFIHPRFERLDAFELKMRHRSLRYGGIQILIDEVA